MSKPLVIPVARFDQKVSHKMSGNYLRDMFSGFLASAITSGALNPMDVSKIRMQTETVVSKNPNVMYSSFTQTVRRIFKEEGLIGLYSPGLVATILRELLYSSIRIGMYNPIRNYFVNDKQQDVGLWTKTVIGCITGTVGSIIACPTDLVKIRLQQEAGHISNGLYVTGLRKGYAPSYPNTFFAFYSIYMRYGIIGLYKGVGPTVVRGAVVTGSQLASYDHTKYVLRSKLNMSEGFGLHIIASSVSGLVCTTACQPMDIVKTRVMCDPDHILYRNSFDCFYKTIQYEGISGLFRGWVPSYVRIGPQNIIIWPLLEHIRKMLGLSYFANDS